MFKECHQDIYKLYLPSFLPQSATQNSLKPSSLVILNDDDVNRLFGWAIKKLRNKYLKVKDHSEIYKVSIGKLVMLDDMSAKITDVLHDERYLRLYYPLDDAIRNKEYLTLCSTCYVHKLSSLLKETRKTIKTDNLSKGTIIPNKDDIIRK